MPKISRRKLAERSAALIASGESKKDALKELAAYLIDSNRVREAELIVRDVEAALANKGLIVATVTSARKLSAGAVIDIESFIKQQYSSSKQVVLRQAINEDLIGGIKLDLPGKSLDASVRAKLEKLTV